MACDAEYMIMDMYRTILLRGGDINEFKTLLREATQRHLGALADQYITLNSWYRCGYIGYTYEYAMSRIADDLACAYGFY